MSLFKIAWRSIQQRGLASILTTASMALGVMLVVSVLLIMGIVSQSFEDNSSLGYNMIIGANKGGKLQIVMNTVFYLSSPVENIPYTLYEEFLPASERGDDRDGEFADHVDFAIPVCLGDYYDQFRVIGTTPEMFDDFVYDSDENRKYEFASGRNLETFTPEHGYYEAVLGATVARKMDLKVGDTISPSHGSPDGDTHEEFHIVGVLAPSGKPNDRGVFINLEGFFLLENHSKPIDKNAWIKIVERLRGDGRITDAQAKLLFDNPDLAAQVELTESANYPPGLPTVEEQAAASNVSKISPERQLLRPLSIPQREVTAVLVRTENLLVSSYLKNSVNDPANAFDGQAVMPIREIYSLFRNIVTPIKMVLLLLTAMICIVSGVGILVSIYNSMSDRKHEIAVMRALGADRRTVMVVVLLESIILALAGGFLGWIAGHLLIGGLASPLIENRTGVQIGLFDFSPKVNLFSWLGNSPIMDWGISGEVLLVPGLILLAIIVGLMPALAAYRTDVAESL